MIIVVENYPNNAFIISLAAGMIITLGGLATAVIGAFCGACIAGIASAQGQTGAGLGAGTLVLVLLSLGSLSGILVIIGAMFIQRGGIDSVRNGSILVIIFSIFGLAGLNPLSAIGMVLGLIGGIMGITWKPEVTSVKESNPPS